MADRVASVANRLRMVQVDFAEHPPDVRHEFLLEEVVRAIANVVPQQRRHFLDRLQEKFPTWDKLDLTAHTSAVPVGRSTFDEKELKEWTFLVEKLVELAPTLPDQTKLIVGERLAAAGYETVKGGQNGTLELNAAVRSKLQLAGADQIDSGRAVELLDMLIEFSTGLDLLAWNTWKTLAPQSSVRRSTPLQKMMGRFASGDAEVPNTVISQEIGRLRRLVAAIISAVGQVGRKFAEDYVVRFSPAQIEDLVKAQGGSSLFGNAKVRYWDQYVQMSAQQDANAVEHEILAAVAEYAETLIKGLGR